MNKNSKSNFRLKRLHSLFGLLPLCVFVFTHIIENSIFIYGNPTLISMVRSVQAIPFLTEFFTYFTFAALAFHVVYGLFLLRKTDYNSALKSYPYIRNVRFILHRLSCVFIVLFLFLHLSVALSVEDSDVIWTMAASLKNPFIFIAYTLGVISAIFHGTNGLYTAAFSWGFFAKENSYKVLAVISDVIFLIISIIAIAALSTFSSM